MATGAVARNARWRWPRTSWRTLVNSLAADVGLQDLGLPDGSGYEVMHHAAEHHGLKGIALSGYGMTEDLERSKSAGFANHLTKPVDMQTLMEAVSEVAEN